MATNTNRWLYRVTWKSRRGGLCALTVLAPHKGQAMYQALQLQPDLDVMSVEVKAWQWGDPR